MRKLVVALLTVWVLALGVASQAVAFEGGGRKPSEAPLIAPGLHYTGQLNNHMSDANYESRYGDHFDVALYRLPAVVARDQVTVNWHVLPFTHGSGFPVCMAVLQGVDDFSWGTVFGSVTASGSTSCGENGPNFYGVSGSGTGHTAITVQNTDPISTYLVFYSKAQESEVSDLETFPYDFGVEPVRHYLGLSFVPKSKVHANGAVAAAATLANGLPAPDGLPFNLTVTWGGSGVASYTATSVGGRVTFVLALPESAFHERGLFVVSHGADEYQPVSTRTHLQITPPASSAAEIACVKATQRAHALARRVKRLKRNARFARGVTKRRLKHRARHVAKQWSAARAHAQLVCG
jgi:hypothetical protein